MCAAEFAFRNFSSPAWPTQRLSSSTGSLPKPLSASQAEIRTLRSLNFVPALRQATLFPDARLNLLCVTTVKKKGGAA
jgi:hypothetical protein